MNAQPESNFKKAAKSIFVAAALGAALLLGAAPGAHADARSACQHNVEKAELRLDNAIQKHGERSPEADARRHDLNAERQHCWDKFHEWWDGHAHEWHKGHDWDR
ncbi:MAG: hypothetical protein WA755_16320 [Candidatus Acidiferrales bacterium]